MRSALAAVVVVLVVAVLLVAPTGRAGERMPSAMVPVKDALAKLKKNPKTPKGAVALVRFYAEVFEGQQVELFEGDFSNAGFTGDQLVDALSKTQCAPLKRPQLEAAVALVTEYGDALPPELRGYTLGQQGKATEAGPLLLQALEQMQPLNRCTSVHPDDAGRAANRLSAWLTCTGKLAPKTDPKKLEAIRQKSMQCVLESANVVG